MHFDRSAKQIFAAVFLTSLQLVIPPTSFAEEAAFEISPFVGYRVGGQFDLQATDARYKLNDSETFGLLVNLRESANTTWELLYSQQSTSAQLRNSMSTLPFIDTDSKTLQFGGTYLWDGDNIRPYLAMTVGGTHIETSANGSQNETFISGSIGLGLNLWPTKRFGLRLEARAYSILMDADTDLFCRTGPDVNICAARVDGKLLNQVSATAGMVFRF